MVTDALGDEVIVGNWYGYSRNTSGFSHTTLGKVTSVNEKTGKAHLAQCIVKRYLYGEPTDFRKGEVSSGVNMRATMIFPVPAQE